MASETTKTPPEPETTASTVHQIVLRRCPFCGATPVRDKVTRTVYPGDDMPPDLFQFAVVRCETCEFHVSPETWDHRIEDVF